LDKNLKFLATINYDEIFSFRIFLTPLIWLYNHNTLVGPKSLFKKVESSLENRFIGDKIKEYNSNFFKMIGNPSLFTFKKARIISSWFGQFFLKKRLDFFFYKFLSFFSFFYRILFTPLSRDFQIITLFPYDTFILFFK
jgi:hypothetical protein